MRVRYEQKKAKYGHTADRYNLQFVPAVFSHTGQIHDPFKSFVMEQILILKSLFEIIKSLFENKKIAVIISNLIQNVQILI